MAKLPMSRSKKSDDETTKVETPSDPEQMEEAKAQEPESPPEETDPKETPPAEAIKVDAAEKTKPLPPGAKRVVATDPDEKFVLVRPRQDLPRCSIGGKWYSFRKGQEVRVPLDVKRVLQERDII